MIKNILLSVIIISLLSLSFLSLKSVGDYQNSSVYKSNYTITKTEIPVSGTPYDLEKKYYFYKDDYGSIPYIITSANTDNSYDIAWQDMESKQIKVLKMSAGDKKVKEIVPQFIGSVYKLLGFTNVTKDKSYVVAYSIKNKYNIEGFEYRIAGFDQSGKKKFDLHIFGDQPKEKEGARGEPGCAGAGRLVYNSTTGKTGFYLSHTKKWGDGLRHQGGYVGFLSDNGKIITDKRDVPVGKNWYVSHNFDQRMITSGKYYYLLAHGDAYPRSLVISKWLDTLTSEVNIFGTPMIWQKSYFDIPGETGNNRTDTELGDFVQLNDSMFAMVFCSSHGRTNRDICFTSLTEKKPKNPFRYERDSFILHWLTEYKQEDACVPQIAKLKNDRVLVLWEEHNFDNGIIKTMAAELDQEGKIISKQTLDAGIRLQPLCDLVTLPNGDIIWALGDAENKKMVIYRMKY